MFEYVITFIFAFIIGFLTGDKVRSLIFSSLPWTLMKWNDGSLGYRMAPQESAVVQKGEKAYLCIPVNTEHLAPGQKINPFKG